MLQGFEWYVPFDQSHWARLEQTLPVLAQLGVDTLWIPPACKSFGPDSVGYDIYDLYDLGEFDQKGAVATKYGTKKELVNLARVAEMFGIGVIFDVVISHKAGADDIEDVRAVKVEQFGESFRRMTYSSIKHFSFFLSFFFCSFLFPFLLEICLLIFKPSNAQTATLRSVGTSKSRPGPSSSTRLEMAVTATSSGTKTTSLALTTMTARRRLGSAGSRARPGQKTPTMSMEITITCAFRTSKSFLCYLFWPNVYSASGCSQTWICRTPTFGANTLDGRNGLLISFPSAACKLPIPFNIRCRIWVIREF